MSRCWLVNPPPKNRPSSSSSESSGSSSSRPFLASTSSSSASSTVTLTGGLGFGRVGFGGRGVDNGTPDFTRLTDSGLGASESFRFRDPEANLDAYSVSNDSIQNVERLEILP